MNPENLNEAPQIVDQAGRPMRRKDDTKCPKCRSDQRVRSGGFGEVHDLCGVCGHDFFGELTV